MPFFGLVWVASWVGCFFSSHQALLKQPRYLSGSLPLPIVAESFDRANLQTSLARLQSTLSEVTARPISASRPAAAAPPDRAEAQLDDSSRPAWLQVATLLWPSPRGESFGAVVPMSYTSSIALSAEDPAQGMVNSPVGMMQNFLWGWRLVAGFPRSHQRPPVTVNSAPLQSKPAAKMESGCQDDASDPDSDSDQDSESAYSPCMLPVSASAPQPLATVFQVRVKNQVVTEVGSQEQANQTAQRLQQLLDRPQLNPTELYPGFDRKVPAARFRDQVLFTVDPEIAKAMGSNPEILAVQWVNALRSALDEPPLSLVEGQVKMYNLRETESEIQGLASWYGPYFHGRQTATGEMFDQDQLTTAHPSLPFDTFLKVTNRKNGKSVVVRVNDRGPYVDNRTLDLSREAARSIDSEHTGVVPITARIMQPLRGTVPPQSLAQL